MRVALVILLAVLLGGAYRPPPLDGHVVDTTGSLTPDDVRDLDLTIDAMGNDGGFALVVLITELGGEPIEDVAYTAFNTWGIGEKGKDNGVLLVIAPKERRVRIETGKGIGGALPDLKTNDIIRETIAPYLARGEVRTAIEDGAIRIAQALRADDSWKRSETQTQTQPTTNGDWKLILGVIALILMLGIGRRRRGGFGGFGGFGRFGGFGGGGRGRGGSGYSGGGGRSGGGGSNASF